MEPAELNEAVNETPDWSIDSVLLDREMRESLCCPVCRDVFRDPTMVLNCGHVFCADCLEGCSRTNCPVCRCQLDGRRVPCFLARTLVSKLVVTCADCGAEQPCDKRSEHKCPARRRYVCSNCDVGTASEAALKLHVALSCPGPPVECLGCGQRIANQRLASAHRSTCVGMRLCCGEYRTTEELTRHRTENALCPKFLVPCPYGCGERLSKSEGHRPNCRAVKRCVWCDSYFSILDDRIGLLPLLSQHLCPKELICCKPCGRWVSREQTELHDKHFHDSREALVIREALFREIGDRVSARFRSILLLAALAEDWSVDVFCDSEVGHRGNFVWTSSTPADDSDSDYSTDPDDSDSDEGDANQGTFRFPLRTNALVVRGSLRLAVCPSTWESAKGFKTQGKKRTVRSTELTVRLGDQRSWASGILTPSDESFNSFRFLVQKAQSKGFCLPLHDVTFEIECSQLRSFVESSGYFPRARPSLD